MDSLVSGKWLQRRMLVTVVEACLKPAIVLAIDGPDAMISRVEVMRARAMLTPGIFPAHRKNVERRSNASAKRIAAGGDAIDLADHALAARKPLGIWRLTDGELAKA